MHLPQSIHFSASEAAFAFSPLAESNINIRKLNSPKLLAEQVAVHVPQPIQIENDGSIAVIFWANVPSFLSRSITLCLLIVYPKSIIQSNLLFPQAKIIIY
jgi:hypothetical protein